MLNEIAPSNKNEELKGMVDNKIEHFWKQVLNHLEVAFPYKSGDGSINESSFNLLRSKILRFGNDAKRELDSVFENYVVLQLFEYEKKQNPNIKTEIIDFSHMWEINKDKFKKGGVK